MISELGRVSVGISDLSWRRFETTTTIKLEKDTHDPEIRDSD